MKLHEKRKLFLGLKLDAGMKRQLEGGPTPGRPIFRAGDPAYLEVVEGGGDTYIGRTLEAGFPSEQLGDVERNIRSIVRLTFPDERPSRSLVLFSLEDEPPAGEGPPSVIR